MLSYIIPICPHQQAKAWLIDTARRRILRDLDTLKLDTPSDTSTHLHFLGDGALDFYLFAPLSACASDTQHASLSANLDAHLAVLATCRLLLLRRKALPDDDTRNKVCSENAMEMIAKSIVKIQKTLLTISNQLSTDSGCEAEVPEPTVVMRTVEGEPIALTPTPSVSSFHLDLLSEATGYIAEILEI